MATTPEEKKNVVRAFMKEGMFGAGPSVAFDTYCIPGYQQHNPRLPNGKEGFLGFALVSMKIPGFTFNVKRMSCEDDLVWIHSDSTGWHWPDEVAPTDPTENKHAWMDIFRVNDEGKITEHWDLYQRIPPFTRSGNPMV